MAIPIAIAAGIGLNEIAAAITIPITGYIAAQIALANNTVRDTISGMVDWVGNKISDIGRAITNTVSLFTSYMNDRFKAVENTLAAAITGVSEFTAKATETAVAAVQTAVNTIAQKISSSLSKGLEGVRDTVGDINLSIERGLTRAKNAIEGLEVSIETALINVANAIKDIPGQIGDIINEQIKFITALFTLSPTALQDFGKGFETLIAYLKEKTKEGGADEPPCNW